MRQVFDNSTVAHKWANQAQERGRSANGNFYFEGDSIFSYGSHFRIAKHHHNDNGEYAVLFTTRTYSVSTSQVTNYTRQALTTNNIIYCHNPNGTAHKENFDQWAYIIEKEAQNLLKAKKPENYLNSMAYEYALAEKYAAYFGLDIPEKVKLAYSISSKEDYLQFNQAKEALKLKQEKEAANKRKAQHKKELAQWKLFKINRLNVRDGKDYLRINFNKERIQTSQAVEIPFKIAKDFYKEILSTIELGGCIDCNKKLMDYTVNSINSKEIIVGCHTVTIREIKNVAKILNW